MYVIKKHLILVSLVPIVLVITSLKSCKTYESYFYSRFSSDCYHNPDVDDNVLGIVKRHLGIEPEEYEVPTEDGHILTLFRIPHEKPKGVILFQHPIFFDSKIWVSQNNNSIAFVFWRAGYDVWLGNNRGTIYSQKHKEMEPTNSKFWNFTLHEMGYYDNNATIEFIRKSTSDSKIIYLGFSQGGTIGLIYAITRPIEAKEALKLMVSISPVTITGHGSSIARYVVPPIIYLQKETFMYPHPKTLSANNWYVILLKTFLQYFPFKKFWGYVVALIGGWTSEEFDPEFVNLVISQADFGISDKVFHHFYQFFQQGKFNMFDYGREGNLVAYNNTEPPLYPIENMQIPIFLVYGQNDSFNTVDDIKVLENLLPEEFKHGSLMVEDFSHADFTYGRSLYEKVYSKIIDILQQF